MRRVILITLFLFAGITAARAETVKATFVYDETVDRLTARLWLERGGMPVKNSSSSSDKLGDATVDIFDDATNTWMPTQTIAKPDPGDFNTSLYVWVLDNAVKRTDAMKMTAGKTYFASCKIHFGGPDGTLRIYETGTTFTITINQQIASATANIASLQGQVSGISQTVVTQETLAQQKADNIKNDTSRTLVAAETTIPQQITSTAAPIKTTVTNIAKSAILDREKTVLLGTITSIRYRTYEGASPTISVYDPNNVMRIAAQRMVATTSPGIYIYSFKFETFWPAGDYTVICSEPTYGTLDAMTLTARAADIETVSSDVSSVLGSVQPAQTVKPTFDSLSAALELVEKNVSQAAETLAGAEAKGAEPSEVAQKMSSLYNNLKDLSAKIKGLGGVQADKLYEMSDARARDIDYIRNKTQELKALLQLNRQLLEGAAKQEPVIQTWMEFR